MRVFAAVLFSTVLLVDSAQAEWHPVRVLANNAPPRAVIAQPGGGFTLLAGERTARRFSWSDPVAAPSISPLPAPPRLAGRPPWAANARGDVVVTARGDRSVRALAVESSGARFPMSARAIAHHEIEEVAVALGADGTAAVARTAVGDTVVEYAERVWLSVHRPGAAAWTSAQIVTAGETDNPAVGVAADGTVELAFTPATAAYYLEWRPGETIGAPVRVASAEYGFGEVRLLAGGPGRSRLVLTEGDVIDVELLSVVRSADGGWLAPQRLGDDPWPLGGIVAGFADGGAVLAYIEGNAVVVHRAAPGLPFGPPQRVGRVKRGWSAYTTSVAVGARGDVLVAWIERSEDERLRFGFICDPMCHERVMAAAAGPDGRFGPPVRVSALGGITAEDLTMAVSDTGARLIAWEAWDGGVEPEGALVAATGGSAPDTELVGDTRPPRLAVKVTRAALRAATAGGRLRMRIGCSEACAARMTVLAADDDDMLDVDGLPAVVRTRAGSRTTTWRLRRGQRRELRRILRFERVYVTLVASDAAGNFAELNRRLG